MNWFHQKSIEGVQRLNTFGKTNYSYIAPNRLFSLGFDDLISDLYWLRFVQYIGDSVEAGNHYSLASIYLDQLTQFDPKLVKAYYFTAFIVGAEQNNPSLAARIIERGIQANNDNWALPFIAGVNQYLFAHDELKAAKYYRMAAKFQDAPKWLERQSEILEAKIPSTIKEINVWNTIHNNASDSVVKERARVKLVALWTQVYKTSPSSQIKNRALIQLSKLGDTNSNLSESNPR